MFTMKIQDGGTSSVKEVFEFKWRGLILLWLCFVLGILGFVGVLCIRHGNVLFGEMFLFLVLPLFLLGGSSWQVDQML